MHEIISNKWLEDSTNPNKTERDEAFSIGQNGEDDKSLAYHLSLLRQPPEQLESQGVTTAPIFTSAVLREAQTYNPALFVQYGLLAGLSDVLETQEAATMHSDPRIFFNTAAPSSTFICGSQGSGKSHTLSCLLENCLIPSGVGKLPKPLTGLVFHYDTFISDHGGSPCEAAFLASHQGLKVRVLCAPTNVRTIQRTYQALGVEVVPLRIGQGDLNTKRMLDLMAVSRDDGPMPLYLHTVNRILREMRILQQYTGADFDYCEFKRQMTETALTAAQLGPLSQRLDTLESFMPSSQISLRSMKGGKRGKTKMSDGEIDWTSKSGVLTIVDLSCPCVTPEAACSLFNVCLSLFLEQDTKVGRVVALDEAHKFMNNSAEASTLTNTLLATVRLQRHLGTRVIISTQEPTISLALLDLCSVTIVHRFTSPEWLHSLKAHLAGVASGVIDEKISSYTGARDEERCRSQRSSRATTIFGEIVGLKVGEALLFSPSAVVAWEPRMSRSSEQVRRLGTGFLKIRVRNRLTTDGGKGVMAI